MIDYRAFNEPHVKTSGNSKTPHLLRIRPMPCWPNAQPPVTGHAGGLEIGH